MGCPSKVKYWGMCVSSNHFLTVSLISGSTTVPNNLAFYGTSASTSSSESQALVKANGTNGHAPTSTLMTSLAFEGVLLHLCEIYEDSSQRREKLFLGKHCTDKQ